MKELNGKRFYEKPQMKAIKIHTEQFIATSGFDARDASVDNYEEDYSFGSTASDI